MALPSTTVFDYPTAEGLAEMIVSQLPPVSVEAAPIRAADTATATSPAVAVAKPQAFTVPDFDGDSSFHYIHHANLE